MINPTKSEQGATPIVLSLAVISVLAIMVVANVGSFKDNFLASVYPKDRSFAAETTYSTVKIMPIGDSITHGVKNASTDPDNVMAGYRYYLYNNLKNSFSVDLVGSLISGPSVLEDKDHEGHNGYDCDMLANILTTKVSQYNPDIALVMCGINDFAQPRTDAFRADALKHLEKVIDTISSNNPNTKIIVSTITPSDISYVANLQTNIQNFNKALPELIDKKYKEGKKIYLVDNFNAVTLSDISDNVHPNEPGYQKIANVWQNMLTSILSDPNSNGIVANYSYVKPGSPQTISWYNQTNASGDSWIGLYKKDIPDTQFSNFITWFYLGNCVSNQGTPSTTPQVGKCTINLPNNLAEGLYEFRLYIQGTTLAKKSNQFTVSSTGFPLASFPPTSSPSPSPTPVPSTKQNFIKVNTPSVNKGGRINIIWQNLINPQGASWMGIYKTTDSLTPISSFIEWVYLGNCSKSQGVPATPTITGRCSMTIPTTATSGSYEVRLFLQGTTYTSKSNSFLIN